MLHALLIGLAGGMRSLTPLAVVSLAASTGRLPEDNGAPALLGHPLVTAGLVALAAGELAGDKWDQAPDRIVPPGIAARIITSAVAAAALSRRDQRLPAAALGALAATAAAYVTFNARVEGMIRYGQTPSGLVEDAIAIAASTAIVADASRQPAVARR